MSRKCVFDHPYRQVLFQIQGLRILKLVAPVIPSAHQRMLQNWKLVWIFARIIEESIYQARRDRRASHLHRICDRCALLLPGHPGNDVWTRRHRFGKIAEPGTFAYEIRSHGYNYVNRDLRLRGCLQKQFHKRRSVVLVTRDNGRSLKSEEFFKLIDDDEKVFSFRYPRASPLR